MTDYANQHFEDYVLEKELKSLILLKNAVSDNIDPIEKLDKIWNPFWEVNTKQLNIFVKLQRKVRDIMGPLSKLWTIIEKAKDS